MLPGPFALLGLLTLWTNMNIPIWIYIVAALEGLIGAGLLFWGRQSLVAVIIGVILLADAIIKQCPALSQLWRSPKDSRVQSWRGRANPHRDGR